MEIDSNNDEVKAGLEQKLETAMTRLGYRGDIPDPLYPNDTDDEDEKAGLNNEKSKVNSRDIIEREQKKLKEIPSYKTEAYDYKLKHTKFKPT